MGRKNKRGKAQPQGGKESGKSAAKWRRLLEEFNGGKRKRYSDR